jgi:hypothetical protein
MPTYATLASLLRDILLLSCITAAAAELEWGRLRKEIKYPAAMGQAMDTCSCTSSTHSWQDRMHGPAEEQDKPKAQERPQPSAQ